MGEIQHNLPVAAPTQNLNLKKQDFFLKLDKYTHVPQSEDLCFLRYLFWKNVYCISDSKCNTSLSVIHARPRKCWRVYKNYTGGNKNDP